MTKKLKVLVELKFEDDEWTDNEVLAFVSDAVAFEAGSGDVVCSSNVQFLEDMKYLDILSTLFQKWTTLEGLPAMSADELVVSDSFSLSVEQREFVEAFIVVWDTCNTYAEG